MDLRALLLTTAEPPTHVNKLVSVWPADAGYVDALATGVGGVLFPLCEVGKPIVWRMLWSPDITVSAVSLDNPGGTITNSDLEHTANRTYLART